MNQLPGMFPTWKAAGRYAWTVAAGILLCLAIEIAAVFAIGYLVMEVIR